MRIGYFGGTFDPPHRGHLAVATAAAERFGLAGVMLAPTARQPLKDSAPVASYEDRVEMTRLLCAAAPAATRLTVSTLDAPRPGGAPNFTIDALRSLVKHHDAVSVIVGADSFLDLRRWREPDELLRLAEWIVVSRPGFSLADVSPLRLTNEQAARVHLLDDVHVEISATEVRRRLRERLSVEDMLTPEVEAYIQQHGLYRA